MSGYFFGPFQLDPTKRLLLRNGEIVQLTPKSLEILLMLIEHKGEILDKDQIIEHIWPDTTADDNNLTVNISSLRKALGEKPPQHRYIVTYPGRGYSFVAAVRRADDGATSKHSTDNVRSQPASPGININLGPKQFGAPLAEAMIEPAGGALPLHSSLYIRRPSDDEFYASIIRYDSIVLVKGARQVGKTSLLARGLQQARDWGAKVVLTDFQHFNDASLGSIEKFFLMLAELIAEQLDLDSPPSRMWNQHVGPSSNFERYWKREVLGRIDVPIVWGLDEVDRLFSCDFATEVFALFRSWHNKRALDPEGPWSRLTLAMAYATEAHLFINDLYQSPFNVGTRLQLDDFTFDQVVEINQRYGSPLNTTGELQKLFKFAGGHPYLINRSLWEIKTHGIDISTLIEQSEQDVSIFSNHLHRMIVSLNYDAELSSALKAVLQGRACPTIESFFRLRSAGIVKGHSASEATIRCDLYRIYLQSKL